MLRNIISVSKFLFTVKDNEKSIEKDKSKYENTNDFIRGKNIKKLEYNPPSIKKKYIDEQKRMAARITFPTDIYYKYLALPPSIKKKYRDEQKRMAARITFPTDLLSKYSTESEIMPAKDQIVPPLSPHSLNENEEAQSINLIEDKNISSISGENLFDSAKHLERMKDEWKKRYGIGNQNQITNSNRIE